MNNKIPDHLRIRSEDVEPAMAHIIGKLHAQCEHARGDKHLFFDRLQNFWFVICDINNLSSSLDTPHFSIAASNHLQQVSRYIEKELGICPILDNDPYFPFK
jgi:hypothetical protein